MRILNRYIVREIFRHALLGLAIFTFVFFIPQLVRLMELFVRHSGAPGEVVLLLLCTIPGVLSFTIPIAVLVGVLLGLGRMSADSELIALATLGIGRRKILFPVGVLALAGTAVALVMTLWAGPAALRAFHRIEASLAASQASFQVQPRVFDERFPKRVFYVNDVSPTGTQWRGVFLAESGGENGSRLTLAEEAIVVAEPHRGKLQLHLRGGATHEFSRSEPARYSVTAFGDSDWPIEFSGVAPAAPRVSTIPERKSRDLLAESGPAWREARVEFHRRLAFPAACVVFALLAVPFGSRPRRGGRAAGFLLAVLFIASYYLLFILGTGLARQGKVSPFAGLWAANIILGILALILLPRMEQYRREGKFTARLERLGRWFRSLRIRGRVPQRVNGESASPRNAGRFLSAIFPHLMDLYVFRLFTYNFLLLLGAFIALFEAFTLFQLFDDIVRRHIPIGTVANYFRYFTPQLLYQLTPFAALVAVLVSFGILSKNNELVACKALGVSLFRLFVPLLVTGLALSGAMLALDDTYLPYANQRQDAIRNQIKGRPTQTFFQPRRQWIFGESSRIYNYGYFDPARNFFGELTILELDPQTFQVRRRVYASRAHWEEPAKIWVLESGWVRDFSAAAVVRYEPFTVTALSEFTEPPSYFNREDRRAIQMNWQELHAYIEDLHQAGFDVSTLTVQLHRKIAYPLMATIVMLLAMPFALKVGARGALGGAALGVGIGILYWAVANFMEALGGVGQLPPVMAGWSPDLIFFFLALYFFFRIDT